MQICAVRSTRNRNRETNCNGTCPTFKVFTYRFFFFQKTENSAFSDEIRSLKSEKLSLERKVERLTKSENRLKALLKEAGQKQTDKEGECESLRRRVEQFERDLRRSESHQKTESVKLIRKDEEIQKLKLELLKTKDDVKVLIIF